MQSATAAIINPPSLESLDLEVNDQDTALIVNGGYLLLARTSAKETVGRLLNAREQYRTQRRRAFLWNTLCAFLAGATLTCIIGSLFLPPGSTVASVLAMCSVPFVCVLFATVVTVRGEIKVRHRTLIASLRELTSNELVDVGVTPVWNDSMTLYENTDREQEFLGAITPARRDRLVALVDGGNVNAARNVLVRLQEKAQEKAQRVASRRLRKQSRAARNYSPNR